MEENGAEKAVLFTTAKNKITFTRAPRRPGTF